MGICSSSNDKEENYNKQIFLQNLVEWKKIEYYFRQIYGKQLNDEAENWIKQNFHDKFESIVFLLNEKEYLRTDKYRLEESLKRAYEKKYIVKSLKIIDKINTTITFQWSVEIPSPSKPGNRVTIYYKTNSTFLDGKWLTSDHVQYIPQQNQSAPSNNYKSSYWKGVSKALDNNMQVVDDLATYNQGVYLRQYLN